MRVSLNFSFGLLVEYPVYIHTIVGKVQESSCTLLFHPVASLLMLCTERVVRVWCACGARVVVSLCSWGGRDTRLVVLSMNYTPIWSGDMSELVWLRYIVLICLNMRYMCILCSCYVRRFEPILERDTLWCRIWHATCGCVLYKI